MTKHEWRETRLRRARRAAQSKSARDRTGHSHHVPFKIDDLLPYTDPSMHHHMLDTCRHPQDVFSFYFGRLTVENAGQVMLQKRRR